MKLGDGSRRAERVSERTRLRRLMPAEGVLNPGNSKLERVALPYTLNVCTVFSRVSARPESPLAAFEISSEEENVSFVTV